MEWKTDKEIAIGQLVELYNAVGWQTYTKDTAKLLRAITGSHFVYTCWEDNRLIGLARVVSDNATIMYLQDILVHPKHQRRGIGRMLLSRCLEEYQHVRQKVLLTDDREEQKQFYQSLGFSNTRELTKTPLNAFVRIEGVQLS